MARPSKYEEGSMKVFTLRILKSVLKSMKSLAKARNRDLADEIRIAIDDHLSRNNGTKGGLEAEPQHRPRLRTEPERGQHGKESD